MRNTDGKERSRSSRVRSHEFIVAGGYPWAAADEKVYRNFCFCAGFCSYILRCQNSGVESFVHHSPRVGLTFGVSGGSPCIAVRSARAPSVFVPIVKLHLAVSIAQQAMGSST